MGQAAPGSAVGEQAVREQAVRPHGAAPIRPASTVMLVRDAPSGVQVFTLRRVSQMVFAAGMTVFPGGGVHISDGDESVPWAGPGPAHWARALRISAEAARRQVVAAVRELYEETGVLLAGAAGRESGKPDAESIAPDAESIRPAVPNEANGPPAPMLSTRGLVLRAELDAHRVSLAQVLSARRLTLRADLLRPWARWITPPGAPRRYDTFFFLAALPAGQEPDAATSEAASGAWQYPADVLRAGEAGAARLMPPTIAMMTDLAGAGSVAELLATRRMIEPVAPAVLGTAGGVVRVSALGQEYTTRFDRRKP